MISGNIAHSKADTCTVPAYNIPVSTPLQSWLARRYPQRSSIGGPLNRGPLQSILSHEAGTRTARTARRRVISNRQIRGCVPPSQCAIKKPVELFWVHPLFSDLPIVPRSWSSSHATWSAPSPSKVGRPSSKRARTRTLTRTLGATAGVSIVLTTGTLRARFIANVRPVLSLTFGQSH